MTWNHLSINQPHLVYVILGGFTSLFMLCSSFIKERLYIGEATVATLCGIIFGPHAINLINPKEWGNTDQITLEFSRIVLVVQCFAVGVELPKYYIEKHCRSMIFILLPNMIFGWIITSLIIWWMIPPLNWLDSLCVSACVTATDPVLASSVVGKGKFARRVPKHLRDLLSAESGSNDGLAFPFIYLALYLIEHIPDAQKVAFSWFILTILYECVFGCIYGFIIGFIGRHGIKYAEKHDLVDRESFLVFYFVLALFCAGSGSILGVDDLLVGFSAGVGFSNDGWFRQKTEESHVSDVIDLLLNLTYFVYLGTIIPWEQYNNAEFGITPWRLVIIAILVILFRRIPIMMALKPFIPDIKTWREALFAGHFGPIGVGAIFIAILAKAELETGSPTPSMENNPHGPHYVLAWLIWPITTFLVISSILVHGSSIAVFTLGKHINTLALTMSYTAATEDGPGWLNRLPKITSTSRSQAKSITSEIDETEVKGADLSSGMLPPIGVPREFLRRQREEDTQPNNLHMVSPRNRREKKKKTRVDDTGLGGPISQSAIFPQRGKENQSLSFLDSTAYMNESCENEKNEPKDSEVSTRSYQNDNSPHLKPIVKELPSEIEIYKDGEEIIIEKQDGEVQVHSVESEGSNIVVIKPGENQEENTKNAAYAKNDRRRKLGAWRHKVDVAREASSDPKLNSSQRKRGPALAYQFGNTIILEDEDGEVLKTYELPSSSQKQSTSKQPVGTSKVEQSTNYNPTSKPEAAPIQRVISRWGLGKKKPNEPTAEEIEEQEDDKLVRFKIGGKGTRLTKEELIRELQNLDPKTRCKVIQESESSKRIVEPTMRGSNSNTQKLDNKSGLKSPVPDLDQTTPKVESKNTNDAKTFTGLDQSYDEKEYLKRQTTLNYVEPSNEFSETDAERKRREGALKGIDKISLDERGPAYSIPKSNSVVDNDLSNDYNNEYESDEKEDVKQSNYEEETKAEKRRRELALGIEVTSADSHDSDDDSMLRVPPPVANWRGIRFAASPEHPKA